METEQTGRQPLIPQHTMDRNQVPAFLAEGTQIEGQFMLSGITQDATKYAYALSQLDAMSGK